MVIGLQCCHILAGDAGNFLVAQLIVVAQVKGDALLGGQGEQRLLEQGLQRIAVEYRFGLQLADEFFLQRVDALEDARLAPRWWRCGRAK